MFGQATMVPRWGGAGGRGGGGGGEGGKGGGGGGECGGGGGLARFEFLFGAYIRVKVKARWAGFLIACAECKWRVAVRKSWRQGFFLWQGFFGA